MTVVTGTPDPKQQQDIQSELVELRRRIAELERAKDLLDQRATMSGPAPEAAEKQGEAEDLSQTLTAFVRRVAMILGADKCVILLYDPESNELTAQKPALKFTDEEVAVFRVTLDQGISGEIFRETQPVICGDCTTEPRCIAEGFARFDVRNSLSVPMLIERRNESQQVVERAPIGVIHVFNKRGQNFTEEDQRLLTVLARNGAAVIASARVHQAQDEEKKQLQYTLQSMTSGLLSVSRTGRVQLMNSAVAEMFGVNPATAIGGNYEDVVKDQAIREFLMEGLSQDGDLIREFAIGERFFQGQAALTRDERGVAVGLLCVFSDVTEIRHVERIKSDFVSTVSHELRTPLTAVKGFIRTLLEDPEGEFYDQATRMEFYGIIDSECDRLVRLINDLLSVSRIERGMPLQLNYGQVNIRALVEKCMSFQRSYSTDHTLISEISNDLPIIEADSDKLDQIITNLLSNAIKYSPSGGVITVRAVDEGTQFCISVSDQGMGIPAEHLEKIFQRFHRVHSGDSQRVGGTGIGLFLTKNLVDAHGGIIWVDSTLGKGSTFFFTVPKSPPEGLNN
ncbi:MAG TPA: ATP-binding protein [Armatimonadota bacterium]